MTGDAHDGLVALAAFAKLRDRLVSEVVEASPFRPAAFVRLLQAVRQPFMGFVGSTCPFSQAGNTK